MKNFNFTPAIASIFCFIFKSLTPFNNKFHTPASQSINGLTLKSLTPFNNKFYTPASQSINGLTLKSLTPFNTLFKLLLPFVALSFMLIGCGQKNTSPSDNQGERTNTVIVLDLSDRLLSPNQVASDQALLNAMIETWAAKAKENLYVNAKDRIRILVASQDSALINWRAYDNALTLDLLDVKITDRRKAVEDMKNSWPSVISNLYHAASQAKHSHEYKGAQLWRTFSEVLPGELNIPVASNAAIRTKSQVIVLSDGYLDFEDYSAERQEGKLSSNTKFIKELAEAGANWQQVRDEKQYGLIPTPNAGSIATVTLAQVRPKAHYHKEILQDVWQRWLESSNYKLATMLIADNEAVARQKLRATISQ